MPEPQPMTTMSPESLEYERAGKAFLAARGKDERDAARKRWDAAKAEMDRAIAEHRDAYERGYEDGRRAASPSEEPGLDVERLARAIDHHEHASYDVMQLNPDHLSYYSLASCGEAIAAEYARLAKEPGS